MKTKKKRLWKLVMGRITRASKENIYNLFQKGVDLSVSLNWSASGGANCSTACRLHHASTSKQKIGGCYAITNESMRPAVRESAEKKSRLSPLEIIGKAYIQLGELFTELELQGLRLVWFRFSSVGSVPRKSQIPIAQRKRFETLLRMLVQALVSKGVKIHFPVESRSKRDYYQGIVGDLCVVRLSLQSRKAEVTEEAACSFVVGEEIRLHNSKSVKRDRIKLARERASERYKKTGRKTIVCPAIVSTFQKRPKKIQCGKCDACERKNVDVVYPLHV